MNRNIKSLLVIAVSMALTCAPPALAQKTGKQPAQTLSKINDKQIVGLVTDTEGEPLPGASVMIKGTTIGTSTDIDGNFTLLCDQAEPTIIVSYVGMKTYESKLPKGFRVLSVKLQPNENLMNEIVVTGYQSLKRENATGAFQTISAEDLDKKSTLSLASRLEGSVPGLVYDPKSSSSDEDAFMIRGVSSFDAKTSPLVVVDGLPIEGGMSTVNPYDIENITILKDAAASSIYGARAANGVIVITTKRAKGGSLSIDFNADVTISDKMNYDNYGWANAAQMIELEQYNWDYMMQDPSKRYINNLVTNYEQGHLSSISPVSRLFVRNYMGELSDSELASTLSQWSKNDYRKEYADVHDRNQVVQQYNLAIRNTSQRLNSSLNVNYANDNLGVQKEHSNTLTFKYSGDLKLAPWANIRFGVNIINRNSKKHNFGSIADYGGINSFQPYQSMYNADGSLRGLETDIWLDNPVFSNPAFELKDNSFNLVEEMNRNYQKDRYTNTRTYINAQFTLLPGWTVTGMFQYEDIYNRNRTDNEAESYFARSLFNKYTTGGQVTVWEDIPEDEWWAGYFSGADWIDFDHIFQKSNLYNYPTVHHVPDGGILQTYTSENQFYTFRAQTDYRRDFGKHQIDALGGFEYRQTHTTSDYDVRYGYNPTTLINQNILTDWSFINNPTTGIFGSDGTPYGAPSNFKMYDTLHRYYSLYLNGNYTYDYRYALSASWRLDKTDLFGTDPKFRGRPLWSVGASWNIQNEKFMRDITWVNALKLRVSYGLQGNIDSNTSSYLTAAFSTNVYTGSMVGSLKTPPNDQLRWEKTSTWNLGLDFALLAYRLSGSIDFYNKSGSDLLTLTDLDATTGWKSLTINNGEMTNRGIEIGLNGKIIEAKRRSDIGINLGVNLAYNKNEVTKVFHYAKSGYEYLSTKLREGYPLNSIFSYDDAGIVEENGNYFLAWRDHEGETHTTSITNTAFSIPDAVYCGSATPVWTGSLLPEIKWNGFSLSAMANFYGGHYMRVGNDEYNIQVGGAGGYVTSFGDGAVSAKALEYWHGNKDYPANGVASDKFDTMQVYYASYRKSNVVHADYLKIRNIVLSYNFDSKICRKIRFNDIRLRFQMNNVATWARNGRSLDPEAIMSGYHTDKTPKSYTFSIFFTL